MNCEYFEVFASVAGDSVPRDNYRQCKFDLEGEGTVLPCLETLEPVTH